MFFAASQIHDGYKFLPQGTVLETFADGTIKAIHHQSPKGDIQFYEGVICPGFVNTHCHLELSHLKGAIPEHTGLIPFLKNIPIIRTNYSDEQKKIARQKAYHELISNGIVAVGDIANTTENIDIRELDKLHLHTFVEAIGFNSHRVAESFAYAEKVYDVYAKQPVKEKILQQSIVPHAPYSVSQSLFSLISNHQLTNILSIHNQESEDENEFYHHKTGNVKSLLDGFQIDYSSFNASGKSSLQTYGEWIDPTHPLILVHNTTSQKEDVAYAVARFSNLFFCLCPHANLYIENKLPNVTLLTGMNVNICIGTDSLASNHQLSVLSELLLLHEHFGISWEALLQWGTMNGARALQMDKIIGSFEIGKKSGIVHLSSLDSESKITIIA